MKRKGFIKNIPVLLPWLLLLLALGLVFSQVERPAALVNVGVQWARVGALAIVMTAIILSGGIDDVWQDTRNGKLVVADYKSQANNKSLSPYSYLGDPYHKGYKIQMDIYVYICVYVFVEPLELPEKILE